MPKVKVGDTIEIIHMQGQHDYKGKQGVVKEVDGKGNLHGTWGGLALIQNLDNFEVIERKEDNGNDLHR